MADDSTPSGPPPSDRHRDALDVAGQAYRHAQEEQRRFQEMVRAATVPVDLAGPSAVSEAWAGQLRATEEMDRIWASFAGVGTGVSAVAESLSKSVADRFAGIGDTRELFARSGLDEALAKSFQPPAFEMPAITSALDEIAAGLGKSWMAEMASFDFPKVYAGVDLEPTRMALEELLAEPIPRGQFEIADASRETARAVRDLLAVTEAEQGTLRALTEAVGKLVEVGVAAEERERERDAVAARRSRVNTSLTVAAVVFAAVSTVVSVLAYRHGTSSGPVSPRPVTATPAAPATTVTVPAPQSPATPPATAGRNGEGTPAVD